MASKNSKAMNSTSGSRPAKNDGKKLALVGVDTVVVNGEHLPLEVVPPDFRVEETLQTLEALRQEVIAEQRETEVLGRQIDAKLARIRERLAA